MKSANNIKPRNGVPYCKKCGKIFKEKVAINGLPVIGYAVECRCNKQKDKENKDA